MKNWNPRYSDCYFTPNEGIQESLQVFFDGNYLADRLLERLSTSGVSFTIIETGFGSGLNVYLTAALAHKMGLRGALQLYSVEKYPLEPEALRQVLSESQLAVQPSANKELLESMLVYAAQYNTPKPGWNTDVLFADAGFQITLSLYCGDVLNYLKSLHEKSVMADAVFLDGHSPKKNPAMWSAQVFYALSQCLWEGATVSTYTASGIVKQGLRNAGFLVKRYPGYGKKHHSLRGTYRPRG